MTEKEGRNLWQDHSLRYLEMAFKTDRMEVVAHPDGYGKRTCECGDTIEMFLTLDNGTVQHVSFRINGCLNTVACANTVAHLVEGKKVEEAWDITPEDVADYLETLPEQEFHCAELAVGAFYLALADAKRRKEEPWKKIYRS